jgi:hypothetical protein
MGRNLVLRNTQRHLWGVGGLRVKEKEKEKEKYKYKWMWGETLLNLYTF